MNKGLKVGDKIRFKSGAYSFRKVTDGEILCIVSAYYDSDEVQVQNAKGHTWWTYDKYIDKCTELRSVIEILNGDDKK